MATVKHGDLRIQRSTTASKQALKEERMAAFLKVYAERNPHLVDTYERAIKNAQATDPRQGVIDIGTDALEKFYKTLGHHIGDVGTLANHSRVLFVEWINLLLDPERSYPILGLFPKQMLDNNTLSFQVQMSAITLPQFTPATEGTLPRFAGVQYTEWSEKAKRVHVGLQSDLTAIMTTLGAKEAVAHASLIKDAAAKYLELTVYSKLKNAAADVWAMSLPSSAPGAAYAKRTRYFNAAGRGRIAMASCLQEAKAVVRGITPGVSFDTCISREGLLNELEFEEEVIENRFRDKVGGAKEQIRKLSGFNLREITHNGILDAQRQDITVTERQVMEFYMIKPVQDEDSTISICNLDNQGEFCEVTYEDACCNSMVFNDSQTLPSAEGPADGNMDDEEFARRYLEVVYKMEDGHVWMPSYEDRRRGRHTNAVYFGDWVRLDISVTCKLIRALASAVRKSGQDFNTGLPEPEDAVAVAQFLSPYLLDNDDGAWLACVAERARGMALQTREAVQRAPKPEGQVMRVFQNANRLVKFIAGFVCSLPICPAVLNCIAANRLPSPFCIMLIRPSINVAMDDILLVQSGGQTAEIGYNFPITIYGDDAQVNQRHAIISFYHAMVVKDPQRCVRIPDVAIREHHSGGGVNWLQETGAGWFGDMVAIVVPPKDDVMDLCRVPYITGSSRNTLHEWIVMHIVYLLKKMDPSVDIGTMQMPAITIDRGVWEVNGRIVNSTGLFGYLGNDTIGNYKRAQMTAKPRGTVGYNDWTS